jgi:radical SAM protein with 4Fe4S-binding SPASM domain
MACAQIPELPLDEFSREVVAKWLENRVPLSGSLELDLRCNLRCLHCYRDGEWPSGILTTDEVKRILDEIAAAGTIWILFTGGEIFLRPDFFEIYEHARRLGLRVTLFTNGTTLTERIADTLKEQPPEMVEVSLYGFSQETYEKVTGIPGSRAKCYRGVELLLERGLPVKLKTVVMRTNQHELEAMARYAEGHGVRFKFDAMINPNFNGALVPCNVRMSPEEAVDLEFSIPGRLEEFRRYFEDRKDYRSSRIFSCGAGSRTFHIDPYGQMMMCLLLREPAFSLKERSFVEIWNEMFPPVYNRMRNPDHQCNSCNFVSLCGKCAAWSQMEKGSIESRVEWSCEVGHRRAAKLGYYEGPVDQFTRKKRDEHEEVLLPVLQA